MILKVPCALRIDPPPIPEVLPKAIPGQKCGLLIEGVDVRADLLHGGKGQWIAGRCQAAILFIPSDRRHCARGEVAVKRPRVIAKPRQTDLQHQRERQINQEKLDVGGAPRAWSPAGVGEGGQESEAASRLHESGASLVEIQHFLGHRTPTQTATSIRPRRQGARTRVRPLGSA